MIRAPVLVDRAAADLLAGQLVAHPDRRREVWIDPAAVPSTAGEVLRVLLRIPGDATEALEAAGLRGIADGCAEAWFNYPLGIQELQKRLRDAERRRVLRLVARVLDAIASDQGVPLHSPLASFRCVDDCQRAQVATVLRWVLEQLDTAEPARRAVA